MKLFLFDLDRVLVETEGHDGAFIFVFEKIYGLEVSKERFPETRGMTDLQVYFHFLSPYFPEEEIVKKLEKARRKMTDWYRKWIKDKEAKALPGVKDFLEKLKKEKVPRGVVTGNLKGIAKIKLQKAALLKYFDPFFGGFGEDGKERIKLLERVIAGAEEILTQKFSKKEVIYFDDTPRGIEVGNKLSIRVIGVATGNYSVEELKRFTPYVIEKLSDFKE